MGHVMGLGHTTSSSIMMQRINKPNHPTVHDHTDLANFYPN